MRCARYIRLGSQRRSARSGRSEQHSWLQRQLRRGCQSMVKTSSAATKIIRLDSCLRTRPPCCTCSTCAAANLVAWTLAKHNNEGMRYLIPHCGLCCARTGPRPSSSRESPLTFGSHSSAGFVLPKRSLRCRPRACCRRLHQPMYHQKQTNFRGRNARTDKYKFLV